MPQLGILHVAHARRDALPGADARASTPTASSIGESRRSPTEPALPLPDAYAPLARAARAHRDARRPAELSRRARTTMPRGSATGSPSCCRCRCRSSRACSRSTTPSAARRCSEVPRAAGAASDRPRRARYNFGFERRTTRNAEQPWPATANGRTSSTRRPRPTPSAARSSPASSRKSRSPRAWAAATRR